MTKVTKGLDHETIKIDSDFINELIDANYAVLLAFDVADGNLSVKDYMEKLRSYTKGNDGK